MVLEESIVTGAIQGGVASLTTLMLIKYLMPKIDKIDSNVSEIKGVIEKCKK